MILQKTPDHPTFRDIQLPNMELVSDSALQVEAEVKMVDQGIVKLILKATLSTGLGIFNSEVPLGMSVD